MGCAKNVNLGQVIKKEISREDGNGSTDEKNYDNPEWHRLNEGRSFSQLKWGIVRVVQNKLPLSILLHGVFPSSVYPSYNIDFFIFPQKNAPAPESRTLRTSGF